MVDAENIPACFRADAEVKGRILVLDFNRTIDDVINWINPFRRVVADATHERFKIR